MDSGILRMLDGVWTLVHTHLYSTPGEHFAFLLAQTSYSGGTPVFIVSNAILVPDTEVSFSATGWEISTDALVNVINIAARSGEALIEVHNHGGVRPRFSSIDRKGLLDFPRYVCESLPGHAYGATVWGDSTVYGEYFLPDGTTGPIRSVTVCDAQLRQVVSRDDDLAAIPETFDRQLAWFTTEGQRQLGRLRVGIVGVGGTGSIVVQNLVYLGVRDFVIVDHDAADESNQNRLITSTPADLETPKGILARKLIRSVAADAVVTFIEAELQTLESLDAIKGVDVIFGCVDNDGARLVLNELAIAYCIPYIDLGVGINTDNGEVVTAGGRVAVVLPGGPCLCCMGEIDVTEAAYDLASPDQQEFQVRRGYIRNMDVRAPAVVSLNGAVASAATNEFAVLVSGLRPTSALTELDLLGSGQSIQSQWMTPRRVAANPACVQCASARIGHRAELERYVASR